MSGDPVPYESLEALRDSLAVMGQYSPEYWDKMMHRVPTAPVVPDRRAWLTQRCTGKRVLHVGSHGPLHEVLRPVCVALYGVDRVTHGPHTYAVDLDRAPDDLPVLPDVDLVLCGEVLEHLSNPGWLLAMLRDTYAVCPVIITVPNAFAEAGRGALHRGYEQVNCDHVAWYSWRTLTTLVERYGYQVQEFLWYHGVPLTAEGLIMVCQALQRGDPHP